MKKLSILAAFFCLFLTGAVSAQKNEATTANFAGTWELDVEKSKLPERMRFDSGTLVVAQTSKDLTVATDFKRALRTENPLGEGGGGGMRPDGNRGGMRRGGGNGTVTYNLDGNETINEPENPAGTPSVVSKLKAETGKDGKLKLTSSRTSTTQMGAMTVKNVETWELLDDGKTLKITRETETPRGAQTAEMYFTKRDLGSTSVSSSDTTAANGVSAKELGVDYAKGVNGAVKNNSAASEILKPLGNLQKGTALALPQPKYPKEARKANAGGVVTMQINIDERGNVVSAKLVEGDPIFTDVCVEAAKKAKFTPTTVDGKPVKVTANISYNFIP